MGTGFSIAIIKEYEGSVNSETAIKSGKSGIVFPLSNVDRKQVILIDIPIQGLLFFRPAGKFNGWPEGTMEHEPQCLQIIFVNLQGKSDLVLSILFLHQFWPGMVMKRWIACLISGLLTYRTKS